MKTAALALLLGAALLAVGLACDDVGDSLTLDEYFAEMETILYDSFDDFDSFKSDWDERRASAGDLTDKELLELDRGETLAQLAAYNHTVSRVRELEPPPEASAAHGAYLQAITEIDDLFSNFVSSEEHTDQGFDQESEIFIEASDRWFSTCTVLIEIAEANDVDAQPCGFPSR